MPRFFVNFVAEKESQSRKSDVKHSFAVYCYFNFVILITSVLNRVSIPKSYFVMSVIILLLSIDYLKSYFIKTYRCAIK